MGRHNRRRFLKKQKEKKRAENNISHVEESETISDDWNTTSEVLEPSKVKSWITSGTKYVYIIAITALLCGIFTPYTLGFALEQVILGMLLLFLIVGSGVLIYIGTKREQSSSKLILAGLGLIIISFVLIYEIAERPLFG